MKSKSGTPKRLTLSDVSKILEAEEKAALIALLMELAKDMKPVRERLLTFAARRCGPDTEVQNAHRLLQQAIKVSGHIHYREAKGWAKNVDAAIDEVERLLGEGLAAAVVDLCEFALVALVDAALGMDDSDGYFSELRDRVEEIHYSACERSGADPVKLATRLFEYETTSEFDLFDGAIERYAALLGPEGMKRYRELAAAEWEKDSRRRDADRNFSIARIMESLAKLSGDVEALVAVKSRDLSSAYNYLQVAEIYREAGERGQALAWAEKGMQAFPERIDTRLLQFAADEYHHQRLHDKAMALIWKIYTEWPSLNHFTLLESHAAQAHAWPEWRERALSELRRRLDTSGRNDRSTLIEVFLYEKNVEEAWREAQAGNCFESLWLRLAELRGEEHPADAGAIYWRVAETNLAAIRNSRYEHAVDLLVKAATAMNRAGQNVEFRRKLELLKVRYGTKRNFMQLLEQKRKLLYIG